MRSATTAPAGRRRLAQVRAYFAEAAGTAAKFLARPDGPRIGALAFDGWDTHVNEGVAERAARQSARRARRRASPRSRPAWATAWRETVVAVVTEFGRTARINGTEGTDHGTGTVALLVGGALKGGRVIADWPGLKDADLHEKRDLKPTTDLRAVLKGVLQGSPARRRARAGAKRCSPAATPSSRWRGWLPRREGGRAITSPGRPQNASGAVVGGR